MEIYQGTCCGNAEYYLTRLLALTDGERRTSPWISPESILRSLSDNRDIVSVWMSPTTWDWEIVFDGHVFVCAFVPSIGYVVMDSYIDKKRLEARVFSTSEQFAEFLSNVSASPSKDQWSTMAHIDSRTDDFCLAANYRIEVDYRNPNPNYERLLLELVKQLCISHC